MEDTITVNGTIYHSDDKLNRILNSHYKASNEYLKIVTKLNEANEVIDSIHDHAESCSIFIYDDRGCTCHFDKVEEYKQRIKND